jgi:hypothetical protein
MQEVAAAAQDGPIAVTWHRRGPDGQGNKMQVATNALMLDLRLASCIPKETIYGMEGLS